MAERNRIAELFQRFLDQWRADWCIADTIIDDRESTTEASASCEVYGMVGTLRLSWRPAAHQAVCPSSHTDTFSVEDVMRRAIQTMLFGQDRPLASMGKTEISIAEEVSAGACADWLARLAALPCSLPSADQKQPLTSSPPAPQFGDGFLRVLCGWCGGQLSFWLTASQVQQMLSHVSESREAAKKSHVPTAPRIGVAAALSHKQVSLGIQLRGVELSLGRILDLREGDIIALDHLLAQPLQVLAEDGTMVSGAWLGSVGTLKAIELTTAVEA